MPTYTIAFWNVENLFDVAGSSHRSEKLERTLKNELAGWTSTVLDKKVLQLASVIRQMNGGAGPDILGVSEIENEYVLKLLVDALAPLNRNYDIVHWDTSDERGIDVAFVFDRDLVTAEKKFSHFIQKRNATRDLLQVDFRTTAGKLLVLIGNHWPSRTGGQLPTEPYRMMAGENLAYFHTRIREELKDENAAIIAMGDFNDEPFNQSLVDYALSDRSRTKVVKAEKAKFLNLMWPLLGRNMGSHYFDNNANMLDQFLVSKGLLNSKSGFDALVDSVAIFRVPEMIKTGEYPGPIKFSRPSAPKEFNENGFSDHFPIIFQVKENM
jgi:predicted extracellular nuclease